MIYVKDNSNTINLSNLIGHLVKIDEHIGVMTEIKSDSVVIVDIKYLSRQEYFGFPIELIQ